MSPSMANTNINDKITDEPLPPIFEYPESYNQLNTILSYYNLPNLHPSDSVFDKAKALVRIKESFSDFIFEDKEILDKLENIKTLKNIEHETDLMEIELANLKAFMDDNLNLQSFEELENSLNKLKKKDQKFNLKNEYESYKNIIQDILNGKSYEYLSIYKNKTRGAYLKQKVIERLRNSQDDNMRVLNMIVECDSAKIEDLSATIKIDRVELLRIIYNYSAKGILEYDRLNDSVSIREN